MSFLDKIIAAVTPPESDQTRMEARAEARRMARPGDWLGQAIDHHDQIESAFAAVKGAADATAQRTAQKKLGVILTGHSIAEEAVLYPALVDDGHKAHAGLGYEEQAAAKIQMALLEGLTPMTQEYLDKLEHIRGAVTHHMYQEESSWFLGLHKEAPDDVQARLTERYREEAERYLGTQASAR